MRPITISMATDCDVLNMGLCDHHKNRMAKGPVRLFVIMDSLGSHPRWLPTVYKIKSKGLSMAFKASWVWSNYSHDYHLPIPGTWYSVFWTLTLFHASMPFLSFLFFKMPHPPPPPPVFFLNLMKPASFWKESPSVSHLVMSDCLWPHGL